MSKTARSPAPSAARSLVCKTKPDLDLKKVRAVVAQSVQEIAKHQATSGGWYYTPGNPNADEGSTTVFAVQALVAEPSGKIRSAARHCRRSSRR